MNNNNDTASRKGQTITFYSYKGGVGRSMALVNIACLAAKENKKVLLIDGDLEAPGLHNFFKTPEETPGFVDLVARLCEWVDKEENNDEQGYVQFMNEHISQYVAANISPFSANVAGLNANDPTETLQKSITTDQTITVDLIKAGRFDENYSKKLGSIHWLELYEKAPAFFRTFAIWLEKQYDYIFVDARTGLADTSGICTMLMPQKLVLVFVLNNQNINGVVDVARQSIDYRFESNDHRRLDIYPLPSRIENSVNPYLQQWIDKYKGKFEDLFKSKYKLDDCRLSSYFDRCFIQYYAIHAYGENIPALYENAGSSNFITYNYLNFYTVLKKNVPSWDVNSLEHEQNNEAQANEHFRIGLDLYYKKELAKSIEQYNIAIELKPDYANAYFNRGLAKEALEQYEEAISDYEKVLKLESHAADAYCAIGTALDKLNKPEKSLPYFDKAIELKPDYTEAYTNRAFSLSELKQYKEALLDIDKAISLKSDYPIAYFNRAMINSNMNANEEALKDFARALELKPDYPDAYYFRGTLHKRLNNSEEALKDFDRAIILKPDFENAYIMNGNVKSNLTRYQEAISDYNRAIEINPKSELGFYNRGLAYESLKQYEEALKDYQMANLLNPGYQDTLKNIETVTRLLKVQQIK